MKSTFILCITIAVSACTSIESYYQPPPNAPHAWKKSGSTIETVKADLLQCHYIDNITKLNGNQFSKQTSCMQNKGYSIDTSKYNAHNCYGSAPAMCALVWK